MDSISSFQDAIQDAGLGRPDISVNDTLNRFSCLKCEAEGKRRNRNAWYRYFNGRTPGGAFGCWRCGAIGTWCSKKSLAGKEHDEFQSHMESVKLERDKALAETHRKARERAAWIWDHAKEANTHPYLEAKDIHSHGLKIHKGALIVPIRSEVGELASLQFIPPNGASKRFLKDGETAGGFYILGGISDRIFIGEGYATMASCFEATGVGCVVAFNASNLLSVAKAIRKRHPNGEIIFAADNDQWTDGNPGVTRAKEAALAIGGKLAIPDFKDVSAKPTDFNDLHQQEDLSTVSDQLSAGAPVQAEGSDQEAIARLAKMSAAEYESKRKEAAEKLGWRRSFLDEEVKRAREGAKVDLGAALPAGKGQGLNATEADPWPDPIDLNEALNELVTEINRYAVLPAHADTAIALWIAHTYVYDARDISPFLFLTSPVKRCGKSTVLIFLLGLVNRPMVASNISPSSIFRVIEACRPTLLIDEADTFFNKNEELRGVMNSGHTKPLAYVIRTVDIGGGVFEPRQFSTWAPKAVAGIRRLADTLEDRSIIVELKRKLPGEHTERIAKFNGDTIRRKLTRWARDNFGAIKHADPQLPTGVYNRLADNWLPLLAIAELAGVKWTDRALEALLAGMDNDSRTDSSGVMLFSDLKDLFNEKDNPESLATHEILDRLHEMDDRSWPAWGRLNKPITSDALARLLKPFKVKPQQIKALSGKGYRLADLLDAFDRYIPKNIPISPPSNSKPRNQQGTKPFSSETNPKPGAWQVSSENQPKPAPDKASFEVSTRKGGNISERDLVDYEEGDV